jgi:hypothetical protein
MAGNQPSTSPAEAGEANCTEVVHVVAEPYGEKPVKEVLPMQSPTR